MDDNSYERETLSSIRGQFILLFDWFLCYLSNQTDTDHFIIVDTNIWLYPDFISGLKESLRNYNMQLSILNSCYDELLNIRKRNNNTARQARKAVALIEELLDEGLLAIENITINSNRHAYADPKIIRFIADKPDFSFFIITNDRDLRIRIKSIAPNAYVSSISHKLWGEYEYIDITDIDACLADYREYLNHFRKYIDGFEGFDSFDEMLAALTESVEKITAVRAKSEAEEEKRRAELEALREEASKPKPYQPINWDEIGKSNKKDNDSSCFITTAVCKTLGKRDDCEELRKFRAFRGYFYAFIYGNGSRNNGILCHCSPYLRKN